MGTGFLYAPTIGYSGSDSFTYKLIDDTFLLSNTATVTLNIGSVNTAPVASGATYTFNEDSVLTGVLIATDAEMNSLTYIVDIGPLLGFLTVTS